MSNNPDYDVGPDEPLSGIEITMAYVTGDTERTAAGQVPANFSIRSGLPAIGADLDLNGKDRPVLLRVLDRKFYGRPGHLCCCLIVGDSRGRWISMTAAPQGKSPVERKTFANPVSGHLIENVHVFYGFQPLSLRGHRPLTPHPDESDQLAGRAGIPPHFLLGDRGIPAIGQDLELRGKYFPVLFTVADVEWYVSNTGRGAGVMLTLHEKMVAVSHLSAAQAARMSAQRGITPARRNP